MARSGNLYASYLSEQSPFATPGQYLTRLGPLAVAALAPLWLSEFWMHLAIQSLAAVLAIIGLHVIAGLTGELSLAHAAFVASGGYVAGVVSNETGLQLQWAVLIAIMFAVVFGVIVGIPSLRLERLYFAVATLAFQVAFLFAVRQFDVTGKNTGLRIDQTVLFGWTLESRADFFYLLLAVCAGAALMVATLRRSRTGRALQAIRDKETAAQAAGIPINIYKLGAFGLGASFAAVAGVLVTHYLGSINPESFPVEQSIVYITMIILGGLGSMPGAIAGAVAMSLLPEAVRTASDVLSGVIPSLEQRLLLLQSAAVGVVLVVVLVVAPNGLAGAARRVKRWWNTYPYVQP